MNETLKQLTEEIKVKLAEHFASDEMQKAIEQIKTAEDTGTFEVVVSTADVDRSGETIDQNGWDLSFFKKNPIVLWAHDYSSLPIGVATSIDVIEGKLTAKGKFAPADANPLAQQIRKLYDLKIVRATSVGLIPKEMEGEKILKAELLEFSFVPVPANPFALSLMKKANIEVNEIAEMVTKGILVKDNEPEPTKQELDEIEKEEDKKEPEDKSVEAKAGRVLSEKNRTMISNTVVSLNETVAALQELLDATEPDQGSKGEEARKDTESPKPKVEPAGFTEKDLDDYVLIQRVLRSINTASSDVLARFNQHNRRKKA